MKRFKKMFTLFAMLALASALAACQEKTECELKGHEIVKIGEAKETTCKDSGLTEGKKCSVCNVVLEEQKEIAKLNHETELKHDGEKHWQECKNCGEKSNEEAHKAVAIGEAKEATCKDAGLTEGKKCSVCNVVLEEQKEIAKLYHEAELKHDGEKHWRECKNCGEKSNEEAHKVVAIGEAKEATCKDSGLTEGKKCLVCNVVLEEQKEIAKLEHDYSFTWYYDETHHYHICECGEKSNEEAHKVVAIGEYVAPTELTSGMTAGKKCSVCEYVIEKREIIPTEHNYEIKHDANKHWYECECGETYEEEEHSFGEAKIEVSENKVVVSKYCSVCKNTITEEMNKVSDGLYKAEDNVYYVTTATGLKAAIGAKYSQIKLLANIDITIEAANGKPQTFVTVAKDANITLDLNGYDITAKTAEVTANLNYSVIANKGTLTIEGEGNITLTHIGKDMEWNNLSAVIENLAGTLYLNGGNFEHLGGSAMNYVVDNNTTGGSGTLVVDGATLTCAYRTIRMFVNGSVNKVVINSGTITSTSNCALWIHHPSSNNYREAVLEINGGTLHSAENSNGIYVWGPEACAYFDKTSITISENATIIYGEGYMEVKGNDHIYEEKIDGVNHWKECTCGDKKDVHELETSLSYVLKEDGYYKVQECSLCDYTYQLKAEVVANGIYAFDGETNYYIADGSVVTISEDLTLDKAILIKGSATINMEAVVTSTLSTGRIFQVIGDKAVVVINASEKTINLSGYGFIEVPNGVKNANITINGGNFTGTTDSGALVKVRHNHESVTVTLNNVNYTDPNGWVYSCDGKAEEYNLTINGGNFTSKIGVLIYGTGEANITNANFTLSEVGSEFAASVTYVKGCTFDVATTNNSNYGIAIGVSNNKTVYVEDTVITNAKIGLGIYSSGGTIVAENVTFGDSFNETTSVRCLDYTNKASYPNAEGKITIDNEIETEKEFLSTIKANANEISITLLNTIECYLNCGLGGSKTEVVNIKGLTTDVKFSDTCPSASYNGSYVTFRTINPEAVMNFSNITLEKTDWSKNTWNTYNIEFYTDVTLTDCIIEHPVTFCEKAEVTNTIINGYRENGTSYASHYAVWICAYADVTIDGGEINGTRGVKIDSEYSVYYNNGEHDEAETKFYISGTKFTLTDTKPAILVKLEWATVETSNVDITNVSADSTNPVWIDEDAPTPTEKMVVVVEGTKLDNASINESILG